MQADQMKRQFNLLQQIRGSIIQVFDRGNRVAGPCDGNVLKLHYKVSLWLLLGGYVAIAYSWWQQDVLICKNKYNADLRIRDDHLNICTSYLYVEDEEALLHGRKYLLFYRWLHWILLIAAFAFYLVPYKMMKRTENLKLKNLFSYLEKANHENRLAGVQSVHQYLALNMGTHDNLYIKYIMLNVCAGLMNIFLFFFIDYTLLGNFNDLGFATYPFARDMESFTDPLSQRFPPFAFCEISEVQMLTNDRTERYGCHLTYMELYEKYFLVLWVWMIFTSTVTVLYVIFLLCFHLGFLRRYILTYGKPFEATKTEVNSIDKALKTLNCGDLYVIYRLKAFLSCRSLYEVLKQLPCRERNSPEKEDASPVKRLCEQKNKRGKVSVKRETTLNMEIVESKIGGLSLLI